jgi:isovaleryl-CoA dehydrogenase
MLSNFRPLVSRVLSNTPKMSFASKDHFYQLMQLDETRRDLMLSIEKFADEEVKPLASKMDKEDVFPKHMWKRMGEMGILGMTAAEEYGGMGLGYFEHCLVVEQLSKANAALALSYLAHSNLCVNQF